MEPEVEKETCKGALPDEGVALRLVGCMLPEPSLLPEPVVVPPPVVAGPLEPVPESAEQEFTIAEPVTGPTLPIAEIPF